jgi:uncharacterized protein YceK
MRCSLIIPLFALVLCSGCATVISHTSSREPGSWDLHEEGVYQGVRLDGAGMGYNGFLIIPCLIDLPLSLVADTLILPYDLAVSE